MRPGGKRVSLGEVYRKFVYLHTQVASGSADTGARVQYPRRGRLRALPTAAEDKELHATLKTKLCELVTLAGLYPEYQRSLSYSISNLRNQTNTSVRLFS